MKGKDLEGVSRFTSQLRELWRADQPDKTVSEGIYQPSLSLGEIVRPLVMFLHYGEEEWNRIKEEWIAHRAMMRAAGTFFSIALKFLKEVQSEFSELITATPEQLRFIEEAKPRYIRVGEDKLVNKEEYLKTILEGDADGTDD